MSSSGYHPPNHLHRANVHPHGKRPFEECSGGYDSDPMPIASGTSSSSTNTHFPATASPAGPHNSETRNKRARSTSSTSTDDSSSHPSSSSGYNTAQSSSRSDIFSDGPSASPGNALDCPIHPAAPPPSFVSTQDVHMSDLHLLIPPSQLQRTHAPSPPTQEDTLRTSLQRFAAFDRQIAALRTSLAATRSSPIPTLGPSVDGDPIPSSDHWHPNSSNFVSNGGSGLFPPTVADPAPPTVAVAPSETLNSLPTFASSNDSANIATSAASGSAPSTSFTPTYSNTPRYPPHSYRPSAGGSSSLGEPVGDAVNPTPGPAFMRPSSSENSTRLGARSSISSATPSTHIRHVRRSLSPLVFAPDPSSSSPPSLVADDVFLGYGTVDAVSGRSHRRGLDNPIPSLDLEARSRLEDHLGEQPLGVSQSRLDERARVIREHSVEREAVPSVFDAFNIGEPSQDRNRTAPAAPRFTSIAGPVAPRGPAAHSERSRVPAPMSTAVTASQPPTQDIHTRLHSSWASIPSSNSLMSESASERRHAHALERFRARFRRSSFDADDELDSRWSGSSRGERERENSGDLGMPPSPSVESGMNSHFPPLGAMRAPPPMSSASFQRSFSDLFAETQRSDREEGPGAWLLDWDTSMTEDRPLERRERGQGGQPERERQRQRLLSTLGRERERQRERSGQDVRGRGFASGPGLTSMSLMTEESSHPLVPSSSTPPRPSLGPPGPGLSTTILNTTSTTNNNQQYSYSNLNLSSFQSGLFRDSLSRNVEVDQASFSTSGPVIPSSIIPGDSRATSRLTFDDSGSEMDLDDFVRTRPASPTDWSRLYAGHTPPPSPPPRNLSLRPGFSASRSSSMVSFDSLAPPQIPNRSSTMFSRPMPSIPSGSTRPNAHENNHLPAPSGRTERDRFLPTRILDTIYRTHEDGRRNGSPGAGQPYHPPNQHHTLAPGSGAVSRSDVLVGSRNTNGSGNRPGPEENRRSSLGFGGSIRSRLARFANAQTSSSRTDTAASSRPQSPPRPIGGRPQADRRRGSLIFGNANGFETETRSASGPPFWAVNAGTAEPATATRDVSWRAPSGSRNAFVPPPPASGAARENSDFSSRVEDHRSRLRTLRQRLQLDRGGDGVRVFRPGMLRAAMGRRGNMGDYVPDELFDDSYEALLSLSSMLGEVRSKATPEEVIASLPTGTFKEWKRDDSETRCPICLDDYEPSDILTKLIECPHWLHKHCLEQWLRTANTCPVCREKVKASPKPAPARRRPQRDTSGPSESNSTPSRTPNAQPNNGRPASFGMVFDRFVSEGRDGTLDSWSPPIPPPPRDARNVYLERLRTQQQQQPPQVRDTYVEFPPPHDLAYHLRPPNQPVPVPVPSTSRPTGDGTLPFGFVSLLRGGSNSSTSSSSGSSMVIDDIGPSARRPMAGPSGSGSLLIDDPPPPRRETMYLPPSSGFSATPSAPPSSFEPREWRRGYDAVLNGDAPRPSSSVPPRPMSVADRIPIDEDDPLEEHVFGWRMYGRRVGAYASGFEERRG